MVKRGTLKTEQSKSLRFLRPLSASLITAFPLPGVLLSASTGSLKEAPQKHTRQNIELVTRYTPLQPTTSNRNCVKGPKIRTPTLLPRETSPMARYWRLQKFLAVISNPAWNIREAPKPYKRLKVKNIKVRLHENEVKSKPTAHITPPAMAVKRQPIVLQSVDPRGPRRNVKPIVSDPTQTEIIKTRKLISQDTLFRDVARNFSNKMFSFYKLWRIDTESDLSKEKQKPPCV